MTVFLVTVRLSDPKWDPWRRSQEGADRPADAAFMGETHLHVDTSVPSTLPFDGRSR
jgi:hypothetical protein